jgi:hypothetical protein
VSGRWRVIGAILGAGVALAGCKASGQLSSQDVFVHLKDGTTEAQNRAVVDKCSATPQISPAPLNKHLQKLSIRFREVRFVVHPATDANKTKLNECLASREFAAYFLFADSGDM